MEPEGGRVPPAMGGLRPAPILGLLIYVRFTAGWFI